MLTSKGQCHYEDDDDYNDIEDDEEDIEDSEDDTSNELDDSGERRKPLFPPVNLLYLREHIENLNRRNDGENCNGFDEEFESIEFESNKYWNSDDYTSSAAECNRFKNRYANVLPTEKTRVPLNFNGEPGSDYINANFIYNHYNEGVYIAAQGPLKNTAYDFWRMVWLQKSDTIVMLTKLKENSKLKCYKYWPNEGDSENYGEFIVTLLSTDYNDTIIIRKLLIENTNTKQEREVHHIQYVEWPDHGLPSSTAKFRETLHLVDKLHKKENPIILHCSAGIGRTGTFCAVHSTLDDISRGSTTLNLPEVVLRMRRDRHGMVQTRDQYEFCYRAILEELESRGYFDIPLS